MNTELGLIEPTGIAIIYGPSDILLNISLAFITGLIASAIYKYTHKGLSYSQSFMLTIVFISVIVSIVMMVIGNNLARAFALVGALSIIRFRTVVKDTKDMAFIFMSLAAGMAAGTSSYFLAIAGTIFFGVIAVVLSITNYGSLYKSEFILRFRAQNREDGRDPIYSPLFEKYTKSANLLHVEPSGDGSNSKLTFDILMKKDFEPNQFSTEIASLENVSEVILVASKNDTDY